MRSTITYIISIFTFSIIILLSLFISGCTTYDGGPKKNQNTLVLVEYTPMQCNVTPWDAWLQNSSIRFIRAPTEQEVITMFYGQYNVTLTDIKIINTSDVTCEACGVCSKGYKITAHARGKDIQLMKDTGWTVWLYQ